MLIYCYCQITDTTLQHLANHCLHLQTLVRSNLIGYNLSNHTQLLSHCERVTDQGITSLVSGGCSSLQVVELDNCPLVSDHSLEVLR